MASDHNRSSRPNFMAYGNEAWGGPLQVRRYLSDANVDWGQQLKTVRQYLDQNPRVLVCLLSGWCRTASRLWHSLPPPSHPERLVMVQTADGRAASH